MGIPKFFRWISERYPLTSQLITPNSIPTFDNLYLDMNGIIHNCSHPASSENDPHFRITEEQMILAIFGYIDHLFTKIKPKKTFFMAIDGVAPRAKMNQQRSRRFRTARDAKEKRREAERKGEVLPEEKAFDSNCITPGTPFMVRLSEHLKYYVTMKIAQDAEWKDVNVIFSGHDVPGEGEHKIQEFIRLTKAQPDYNPNTRHCLYGLDADLIMLGLLSHDPHFCLLREEVNFGRKAKKATGLANTNFFLLHLSLLREYLDLEFSSIAPALPFKYDFERIIDDFILMGIFVGNDFLPNLPDLHINEGALEKIWTVYKEMLPESGGYINEHGTIHLTRLQKLLDGLSKFEVGAFEAEFADEHWYRGKQQKEIDAMEKARKKGKLVITKDQQRFLKQIRKFVTQHQSKPKAGDRCTFVNTLTTRDRRFVQELADDLHLRATWDELDEYEQPLVVLTFDLEGVSEDEVEGNGDESEEEWASEEEDEGDVAIERVFKKYERAKVVDNIMEDFETSYEDTLKEKMTEWKKRYYKEKLEFNYDDSKDLHLLIYKYVEGLQWILNYYYKGVSSWAWYYPYHFAPRLTDLKGIPDMKFNFELGKPFTPFQQLMGVLPEESKEHVPIAYRDLMTDEASPIIDFYPEDFELDMNGKKQDWEAVVKIPFIDQDRLLRAMASRDHRLTAEERSRNRVDNLSIQFHYDRSQEQTYPSSLPGSFPDIARCHCNASSFSLPTLGNGVDLILGLLDGVHLGASALAGFPSLKTLPHNGSLGYHGVNVFQADSHKQSMVITITGKHDRGNTADVAKALLGKRTYHSWPYLQEGLVTSIADDSFKYSMVTAGSSTRMISKPHNPLEAIQWRKIADHVEHHQSKRFGVITGNVEILLHVLPLKGLRRLDTGALVKEYEEESKVVHQPLQLSVSQVTFEDERYLEQAAPPMSVEFPVGERVFYLGQPIMFYGSAAQVVETTDTTLSINTAHFPGEEQETAHFTRTILNRASGHYYPAPVLARRLGISSLALSRITSSLLVQTSEGQKVNIGLSIKFESKGLKVLGYSRRNDRGWEFSEVTFRALEKYKQTFPEVFAHLSTRGGDIVRSTELAPSEDNPDKVIREMKKWLKDEELLDLEPVSLFAEQLEKETVKRVEALADEFRKSKTPDMLKRARIERIPRQAVLKPAHAIYRLQGQSYMLGDRVSMAVDAAAGGVSLGMKGTVIGIATRDIDVLWDVPFMGGETLGNRCSPYRGSTVSFTSCLNLTRPQLAVGMNSAPAPQGAKPAFQPRLGPQPAVQMRNYQPAAPAPHTPHAPTNAPTKILQRPARQQAPRPNGVSNGVSYGAAAQGTRAPVPAVPSAPLSKLEALQSALLGQTNLLAAQAALRAKMAPPPPQQAKPVLPHQHVARSPTKGHVSLPVQAGHTAPRHPLPKAPRQAVPNGPTPAVVSEQQGEGANGHQENGNAGRGRGGRGGRGRARGRGRGRGGSQAVTGQ